VVKEFDEKFSHFDTEHTYDTQTDGIAIAYTRASIALHRLLKDTVSIRKQTWFV